jgi:GcrA cell cycle regulator
MGLSRNAVIGRAHRLGLSKSVPLGPKRAQPHPWKMLKAKAKPNDASAELPPKGSAYGGRSRQDQRLLASKAKLGSRQTGRLCKLIDLTNSSCRYPLGKMYERAEFFCGVPEADLAAGVPYCPFHCEVAYDRRRS